MTVALIWLIAGIVLLVAEVLSGDFVLVMLGLGALAAGVSAQISDGHIVDVAVFAIVSAGLVFFARPALKRRFLTNAGLKSNIEALIGAQAIVLSTIDSHGGQVKLAGETWSARSLVDNDPIAPGVTVTVVEISGATAVVTTGP